MTFEVTSRAGLAGVVWDLRDRAYDHPDPWKRVDAESVFQALAETLEAGDGHEGSPAAPSWAEFADMLRQAADRAAGYASPA